MGRQALLDDVLDDVIRHGFSGRTLRQIADGAGTSHRMLLYHFGSREGLLAALVDAIETSERAATVAILEEATSTEEAARRAWARVRDPRRAGEERLFFELAALTAHRQPGTEIFVERFVAPWLELTGDDPAARAHLRADVATMRGLLLDLLVTGDGDGVDAAFEQWLAMRLRGDRAPGQRRQRERSSS